MRKKLIGLVFAFALAIFMVCGLATAFTGTLSMNLSSSTTVVGEVLVTFSTTGGNLTNITLYGSASDTNQTSASQLNISDNNCMLNISNQGCNFTFNSDSMEDSSNWAIYATGINKSNPSDTTNTATSTAIVVDNGAPTAPTSLVPADGATTDTTGTVVFTSTVLSRNTTEGFIEFKSKNPGNTQYNDELESSSGLSITVENIPEGVYEWRYAASDGVDIAYSSYQTFTVKHDTGGGKAVLYAGAVQRQQLSEQQKQNIAIFVIIAAVVIIVMKKRRK